MQIKDILLNIYFWLRLPFLWGIKMAYRFPDCKPDRPKKFLIIRLDRIGDFVLSLPVIDNIKLQYPDAVIDVLVSPYLKELAEMVKTVDNVICYDNFISTVGRLKENKYDVVLDLLYDYKVRPALLAYLSCAPIRAGFSWGFREVFFNYFVNPLEYPYKDMVGLHLELLTPLKIPQVVIIPKLEIQDKKVSDEVVVVIHPIGYYKSQRWAADRFILLSKKILQTYKARLKIIGSNSDKKIVDYIVSGIDNINAEAVIGGIWDLVFIFKGSKLLVCNHSGPMHLAAALGLPTISIMGPTNPILWWPKGGNNIVIRKDLECSPCLKGNCGVLKCMDLVSVDEVFDKVKLSLKNLGIEESR